MAKRRADCDLIGLKIVDVRPMAAHELEAAGWGAAHEWGPQPIALELEDGTVIYPSRDSAGNGFGALFGQTSEGELVRFTVQTDAKA